MKSTNTWKISYRTQTEWWRLEGTAPSLLAIYAPQSGRTQEDEETIYEELAKTIKAIPKGGSFLIMGDWNAKVEEPENERERE